MAVLILMFQNVNILKKSLNCILNSVCIVFKTVSAVSGYLIRYLVRFRPLLHARGFKNTILVCGTIQPLEALWNVQKAQPLLDVHSFLGNLKQATKE